MYAIEAHSVGKRYALASGERTPSYGTLREALGTLGGVLIRFGRATHRSSESASDAFWALRHVSFNVNFGDRLGIIGRNGAGKSTLLKLVSRITAPTEGKIRLRGRVASLLEVGTGFHPELSGRENIFLNGAILGMHRSEILAKFDAIVEFAEVARFIDVPVKRYSSGMYMRLAFAVAAHLDPELLIVDEVLAVGDSQFQQKCLGRMKEVAADGRTVLFVSHNLGAVRQLCNVALVMDRGRAIGPLPVDEAVELYLRAPQDGAAGELAGDGLTLSGATVNGVSLQSGAEVLGDDELKVQLNYEAHPGRDLCLSLGLKRLHQDGYLEYSHNHLEAIRHRTSSVGTVTAVFPKLNRAPGRYTWDVQAWLDGRVVLPEQRLGEFTITAVPSFESRTVHAAFPAALLSPVLWQLAGSEGGSGTCGKHGREGGIGRDASH
jgi:lipopolysaccharide transport system ATP-binding protein